MLNPSVKFKWEKNSLENLNEKTWLGLIDMASDIQTQARFNAPYLTGALSNSIRTVVLKDVGMVEVVAGGTAFGHNIPYAYYREVMPNRKNPASQHYMRNAMQTVMSGDFMTKYFKGVAQ